MKRSRLWIAVLALAAVSLEPLTARSDTPPGTWDIARDPAVRGRWALHVRVQRLIAGRSPDGEGGPDKELRLEAALALLQESDAAHSPDVRLRYDLGMVYQRLADLQERVDLRLRAVDMLVPALAAGPDDVAATDAMEALVYAYAKLNRPHEELAVWRLYIPRLLNDGARAMAMMNMGEAEMRLGRVDDALGTFREVLRLCGDLPSSIGASSTYVLTLWDLAVALDRSGDPQGALASAAKASLMKVGNSSGRDLVEHDPQVFFIPEWERDWYIALSDASLARLADDARDATRLWAEAERHWDIYVERSSAAGGADPWLAIGRVRRESARAARVAAQKRAAKLPARTLPRGSP
jgi:tetratricopeptide (TPR) repeat protein